LLPYRESKGAFLQISLSRASFRQICRVGQGRGEKIKAFNPKGLKALKVGMAGFEPTTSSTPCWRDTGLRYIPSVRQN
jgi:hypothetical protein